MTEMNQSRFDNDRTSQGTLRRTVTTGFAAMQEDSANLHTSPSNLEHSMQIRRSSRVAATATHCPGAMGNRLELHEYTTVL